MNFLFLLTIIVPFITVLVSIIIYKYIGKKQFLRFDLVQFLYAFLFAPIIFLWSKSFLFYLLKTDSFGKFTYGQIFFIDTLFSVFYLYIFAFIVIHSLTKSFQVKMTTDPFYDIFSDTEFFHLFISHFVIYLGAMVLISIFSILNLFIPLILNLSKLWFYLILLMATIIGFLSFFGIWLYAGVQRGSLKIFKILFGLFVFTHILLYFVFEPSFQPSFIIFWIVFTIFLTMTYCSFFVGNSNKLFRKLKLQILKLLKFKIRNLWLI